MLINPGFALGESARKAFCFERSGAGRPKARVEHASGGRAGKDGVVEDAVFGEGEEIVVEALKFQGVV